MLFLGRMLFLEGRTFYKCIGAIVTILYKSSKVPDIKDDSK